MITKRTVNEIRKSYMIDGQEITFSTGKLAPQADSAITVQMGDNVLLVTTVMNKYPKPELDFLPLTIDRREMYSAGSKIGGAAYRRREGKPSDSCILYARLTDRSMRPLFPKNMINNIVVSVTPLVIDKTQDLSILSLIGGSLSVLMAGIPFAGPIGAVRIGRVDEKFIINPTLDQIKAGDMNLLCSGRKGSINMIECDAKQVPDAVVQEAFLIAQKYIDQTSDIQTEFLAQFTINPRDVMFNKPSAETISFVRSHMSDEIRNRMIGNTKVSFNEEFTLFERMCIESAKAMIEDPTNDHFTESKVKMSVFDVIKNIIRDRTINENLRVDNRDMLTIRPLYTEIDTVPRVHGSGLFRRGDSQALTTTTLGSPSDCLLIDSMEESDVEQRYIHHYNFPPFSTNEAQAIRFVSRRELGHGKLAEKALEAVLPPKSEFPYTMRLVSDCLASGGSTSMASTCASTLSLMAAGVPITAPVSGIAMGLMSETDELGNMLSYKILTDLMGTEDFIGDMDFKIAGTTKGITAIQVDTKLKGIPMNIIQETITQALTGRLEIMEVMMETIATPRPAISQYAPKIFVFTINPDKVRLVIGKGGETINKIIEKSGGVKIDFDDDGTCYVCDSDQSKIDMAVNMIRDIADDVLMNVPIDGVISRVEAYGLFIELPRNQSGLIHISQLGTLTGTIDATFKAGTKLRVIITGKDDKGRLMIKKA